MTSNSKGISLFKCTNFKRVCFCSSAPTVYHAAVIIFLEFFAFGLLTAPMISILDEAFPKHTLLMNGFIQGVKGFFSFLSAPFIGSMSDIFGRKPFLLLTVTFTCCPIPFMKISHWWYFTLMSISGIFSVTFSVVLAFVSDVTTAETRSSAYGLVSATFAASLIISPALGAFLEKSYSENFVITLATVIAFVDIVFILLCVPESLQQSNNFDSSLPVAADESTTRHRRITWDQVDPFGALRRMSRDRLTLLVCSTTFLSYLPEAGQYSCFFVYLRLVMGFSEESVALFIAMCGFVSCLAQTCGLTFLMFWLGSKRTIIVGLTLECVQLAMFGLFSSQRILWSAGCVAGLGSITYPALSAFLSNHSTDDQQGLSQGLLTGIRGLCGGLGPAVYGFIFYIFQVDLTSRKSSTQSILNALHISGWNKNEDISLMLRLKNIHEWLLPGPPFAFGAIMALLAIFVAFCIPHSTPPGSLHKGGSDDHSFRKDLPVEVTDLQAGIYDQSIKETARSTDADSVDLTVQRKTSTEASISKPKWKNLEDQSISKPYYILISSSLFPIYFRLSKFVDPNDISVDSSPSAESLKFGLRSRSLHSAFPRYLMLAEEGPELMSFCRVKFRTHSKRHIFHFQGSCKPSPEVAVDSNKCFLVQASPQLRPIEIPSIS